MDVAVIGGGVIGLCTALNLQRKGFDTAIIDPLPSGSSATYGNASMISPDASVPLSTPGLLKNLPRLLFRSESPLFIKPSYLPIATPWLLKLLRAGKKEQFYRSAKALRELHQQALIEYELLLGEDLYKQNIQTKGQIHIWHNEHPSEAEIIAEKIRKQQGIKTEKIEFDQLKELLPDIAPNVTRALLFTDNGKAYDPFQLAQTIKTLFLKEGGTLKHNKVLKILPQGNGFKLITNSHEFFSKKIVVAAGAWSLELVRPLGIKFPLETERGYHLQIKNPGIRVDYPILCKSLGFGITTIGDELRLAGTVEIAGLRAQPNFSRIKAIKNNAKKIFPALQFDNYASWMGFRSSTPDTLPVLSESKKIPNLFIACGHGHTGLTAGAVSGRLMSEIIAKKECFIDPTPYRLDRF